MLIKHISPLLCLLRPHCLAQVPDATRILQSTFKVIPPGRHHTSSLTATCQENKVQMGLDLLENGPHKDSNIHALSVEPNLGSGARDSILD